MLVYFKKDISQYIKLSLLFLYSITIFFVLTNI